MSVHIYQWSDLKQFGVNALTGEACKLNLRLLCDLSDKGVDLVLDYFGMPHGETVFAKNWNSTVGEEPAVASVMLPRGIFGELCKFILFKEGYAIVAWTTDGGWCGYRNEDLPVGMTVEKMRSIYKEVYRNPAPTGCTTRNQHAFTGRTI